MGILAFIIFLVIAAACAGIAEYLVPGVAPAGFLANAIIGIIGAWIGTALFGHFGPDLGGVSLIPAILGAALLVFCLGILYRPYYRRRTRL